MASKKKGEIEEKFAEINIKPTSTIDYDMVGQSAMFWMVKAEDLRRAARLIWVGVEHDFNDLRKIRDDNFDAESYLSTITPSVMDTFYFIASLSIENLLKGILIFDDDDYLRNGKMHGKLITSHDLIDLVKEARIKLNSNEKIFCELGTSCILHWGRYPIPKNKNDTIQSRSIKGEVFQIFDSLFLHIANELNDRQKKKIGPNGTFKTKYPLHYD